MHSHPWNQPQGDRLWLIAGTGEGPPLAETLLARGWRLQVSVVSRAAAGAYRPHPALDLRIGTIGAGATHASDAGVARELEQAQGLADPFRWVIDASHPFACRISASLARVCSAQGQPLLRLERPLLPLGEATLLPDLLALGEQVAGGERLLLAIGGRQLASVVEHSPQAVHHARLLPAAPGLQQAMAAGLAPERVACLRPGGNGELERALCRRWGISSVLCRRSGGVSEGLWHGISASLGLRLLLIDRPPEPQGSERLALEALLRRLKRP
jgi:precorrin-6A/cobalt-precorrin-6A reductase